MNKEQIIEYIASVNVEQVKETSIEVMTNVISAGIWIFLILLAIGYAAIAIQKITEIIKERDEK